MILPPWLLTLLACFSTPKGQEIPPQTPTQAAPDDAHIPDPSGGEAPPPPRAPEALGFPLMPGLARIDSGRVYGNVGEIHWEACSSALPPAEVAAWYSQTLGKEGVQEHPGAWSWHAETGGGTRVLTVGDTHSFPPLQATPPVEAQTIAAFSVMHNR